MSETPPSFLEATALHPAGEAFTAELGPHWFGDDAPHGGILSALLLRAMLLRVADTPFSTQSFNAHFLRAPAGGEVEIAAELERSGRRTATATATVTQRGRVCVRASAWFTALAPAEIEWTLPAPEQPPFADVLRRSPERFLPPFVQRLDSRPTFGATPFAGDPDARTGGWLQCDPPCEVDAPLVVFLADAWLPSPFVRLPGPAAAPTLDLTVHFVRPLREPLPAQPVAVGFAAPVALGGTFLEDGELWASDGGLIARSRQSALLSAPAAV